MSTAEQLIPPAKRIRAGAFEEGSGYRTRRPNGTTDWLLFHTIAGLGRFCTAGADLLASPGDTLLVRPGTPQDYGVEERLRRWTFLYAHFHPPAEWLPLLEWPEVAPGILGIQPAGDIERRVVAALRRAVRFSRGSLERKELFAFNCLEEVLLWCDTQNPRHGRLDERILLVLEIIEQRLSDPISVSELAEMATLSVSRFSHLFRQQVGLPPREYVERQRLDAAAQLLELTNRSVASIAAEVGFDDPLYFSTRFRRRTGRTPREHRAEAAAGQS